MVGIGSTTAGGDDSLREDNNFDYACLVLLLYLFIFCMR